MDTGPREQGGAIVATVAEAGTGAALWAWQIGRPLRTLAAAAVVTTVRTGVRLTPPHVLAALTERGRTGRAELERHAAVMLRFVVRRIVAAVLETIDLTALVQRHVDLDAVAAGLDLDAAVARVDLDAIVARVDLDGAVGRVDLDAVVRRVDLDAVARRIDLDALATRIDPGPVVARVDLDAILARVDIVGIAREVIDAIDLPEIVRHSTGTMTSDTIRGVRREAMQADEIVAGVLDRLLRRRAQRAPVPP